MTIDERGRASAESLREARRSRDLPDWPKRPAPTRNYAGWAFAAGVIVTFAIMAIPIAVLNSSLGSSAGTDAVATTPPTTIASGGGADDRVMDSEAAREWEAAVLQVTGGLLPDDYVSSSWEVPQQPRSGEVVTELRIPDTDQRLLFDFQAWADGEYQDDPDWIALEGAGSNVPGVTTAHGTVFTYEGPWFSHATLVSQHGALFVLAENLYLPANDLAALAEELIETANRLVTANTLIERQGS